MTRSHRKYSDAFQKNAASNLVEGPEGPAHESSPGVKEPQIYQPHLAITCPLVWLMAGEVQHIILGILMEMMDLVNLSLAISYSHGSQKSKGFP